jgi:hypothetical protein
MLCRLSEAIVHSSARTHAEREIEIFRLRLAQGHIDTLPNLPQLSFCERIRSEVGNELIQFCIEMIGAINCAGSSGSSSSAMPAYGR